MILLRKYRIERGWTQEYVARKIGVTKVTIHDLETGRRKPSYTVLVRLEDLFEIGHRDFMKEEET